VDKYDNTINLKEYIDIYFTQVITYVIDNVVFWWIFPHFS